MWNSRSLFLYVKLHLHNPRHRLRLGWPLALYVPYQLLLSLDSLAGLIPCRAGRWLRATLDTLAALMLELLSAPPQALADIDIEHQAARVRVKVATIGINGGER